MCGNFSLTLPSCLVPSLNQPGHFTEKGEVSECVCGGYVYVLGEGGVVSEQGIGLMNQTVS